MAIGDAYATVAEYREVAGSTRPAADAVISRQLLAASRYLERVSNTFWNKDAAAVARLFVGDGSNVLRLDGDGSPGIATTTGLVIKVDVDDDDNFAEEVAVDNATLRFYPLNAGVGPEPRPFRIVALTPRSTPVTLFPNAKMVQVTAVYGWPAVPSAVKETTIKLVGIWRDENPEASGRIGELDQLVAQSPMAMSLVKRFKNTYKVLIAG